MKYSLESNRQVKTFINDEMASESNLNISVVIPLYNKKSTILRSIASVLEQLDDGDKLFVVDDGSTDGSSNIIRQLSNPKLQILSQPNQGVSAARNFGVQAIDTIHVAFLDADDWWLSGVVQRFKEMIRVWPNSAMYSVGHVRCDPNEKLDVHKLAQVNKAEKLSGNDFIKRYSREQLINSSTSCVKKEYLDKIGGFPTKAKSGEDIYVWLRLALLGSVSICHEQLSVIERPPPDSIKPRDPVPYHIRWFSNREVRKKLNSKQRSAISSFMFFRSINLSAGEVMAGRRGYALRITAACSKINAAFFLPGLLISILPKHVLKRLYSIKHRQRDVQ